MDTLEIYNEIHRIYDQMFDCVGPALEEGNLIVVRKHYINLYNELNKFFEKCYGVKLTNKEIIKYMETNCKELLKYVKTQGKEEEEQFMEKIILTEMIWKII